MILRRAGARGPQRRAEASERARGAGAGARGGHGRLGEQDAGGERAEEQRHPAGRKRL